MEILDTVAVVMHNAQCNEVLILPDSHRHTLVYHGMVRCTSLQHFLKDSEAQCCLNMADLSVTGFLFFGYPFCSVNKLELLYLTQLN